MSALDDLPGSRLLRLATPHARPKGRCDWNPNPGTIQGRLLNDALEVLERFRNHLPIGPRTIMYKLKPRWVPNHYPDKDKLRSALSDVLGKARRAGIIPWEAIDDRRTATAAPWAVEHFPGFYQQMQGERQAGQPYRVEVWVEAVGNLSRIGNICEPYGISVYTGSGSVPIEANRRAALRIIDSIEGGAANAVPDRGRLRSRRREEHRHGAYRGRCPVRRRVWRRSRRSSHRAADRSHRRPSAPAAGR